MNNNNSSISQKTYQIYKIPNNYTIKKIDDNTFDCKSYNKPIEAIIEQLKKNKGYHIRINRDDDTIMFGDLDKMPSEDIFDNFISVLMKEFEVNKEDISYTLSIKNEDNKILYSYHWSIPLIQTKPKILKKHLEDKCFRDFSKYIDLSIYDQKGKWFRLPYQTNKEKIFEHKIMNGKMEDFIVHYIDNRKYILEEYIKTDDDEKDKNNKNNDNFKNEVKNEVKLKKGKNKEEFITRLLDIMDDKRADDYGLWMLVSYAIKNELTHIDEDIALEVFKDFSKRSKKFDEKKDISWFKNLSVNDEGLTIKSLMDYAKEDDKKEYKKLYNEFIEVDDKFKKNNENNLTKDDGVFNDLEAAQKVYSLYSHWKFCDNKLFVYDDKTGMWTESEVVMFNIISRFNDSLYLLTINNNEIKKSSKGYGNSTTLQRQLLPQLKTLCIDNSWLVNTNLSSMNKLLFLNGFYDMSTGIFNEIFDPNIVFFYRIERKYENNINIDYLKSVKQRFFYNQLGEDVGNYLLLNIARALAGNRMKKLFFGLGETDAGKSTYVNATINTFGDYIGTFNGENLCIKNTTSDEAQLMRWAYLLRYKRIIFSNEMKNESVLSGNMMKKISSGGDTLVGRTHGGEEKPFIPHFNVFCNANDLLEIKPFDSAINTRLNIISYKKKYVDEPSNEFELKKDDNIDTEMKTINFLNTFQYILFESYLNFYKNGCKEIIPDAVKNCKTEWVGDQSDNTCINKFLESYEITNNVEHYTKSSDIDVWIKENKLSISVTKFVMELKKYCSIKKYNNVESKNKKINGKVPKVWIGIKKITDEDDEIPSSLDIA